MDQTQARSFEDNLGELEGIVERLERGELTLEEALAAFERGVGLVRALHAALTQAEQRVDVLTRDASGAVHLDPLQKDEADE